MSGPSFSSAGVKTTETDLSGPRSIEPVGVPAGVIGTANKGPAFVPVTVAVDDDFYAKFGLTDGKKFGPLAAVEWLRSAQALTYVRVLGVGLGQQRLTTGNNIGSVQGAGFVVGDQQPDPVTGALVSNSYANLGGTPGRLYFLGAFMSESAGSTVFSDAGLQGPGGNAVSATASVPIVRGVVMAASGVLIRLSSSVGGTNSAPTSTQLGTDGTANGAVLGAVKLLENSVAKQEFVLLLNGHIGSDPARPNVITASFDPTAANYFANVLNRDPYMLNQAGHYLYAYYDVSPALATVTGSGLIADAYSAGGGIALGLETAAFITTGSAARNTGAADIPSYENWEDRFAVGRSPWIVSQKFGGVPRNLFRFWMIDAGAGTADKVKISIENIAPSSDLTYQYGTFDVVIRDFSDRDLNPKILEAFRGVNLDPTSARYIGNVIGDQRVYFDFDHVEGSQKLVVEGNYPNNSNYVRIEVDSVVDTSEMDPSALPMGFRGAGHLITSGSMPLTAGSSSDLMSFASTIVKRSVQPPVPFRSNVTTGTGTTQLVNPSYYWGVQFEQVGSLSQPNASTKPNNTVKAMTKYFPDFQTINANVMVRDNNGAADTAGLGTVDCDRFNRNLFTLENVQVVTNSAGFADANSWVSAAYVRAGSIAANDANKTRALKVADLTQPSNRRYAKFTLFMQGGFDGVRPFDQDTAEMTNIAVTEEMANTSRGLSSGPTVKAYKKAVDIMSDTSEVDIKLLAIPGMKNPVITDYAATSMENRFDAMFIMDIEEHDANDLLVTSSAQLPDVQNTANNFANRGLNTSFAAAYYPDVVMMDPNTSTNVVVPPSVPVLGAMAYNDAVGHPWLAPAGFARATLPTVTETKVKLRQQNVDALSSVGINPLVMFPGSAPTGGAPTPGGVTVWGQKTLYQLASSLDRVNVRRLLIELRRMVRSVGLRVAFEPDRAATLSDFKSKVDPILAKVQRQGGLQRFKVVIDTSTTTQTDIENNTIRGKIYVQPVKSLEFVSLDFTVSNKLASAV